MAKKKSEPQTDTTKPQQDNKINRNQPTAMADDAASENSQIDSLKSLNAMLLKETVDRRQQVESLVQTNGDLELELKRSIMDKDSLKSEMSSLAEEAIMMEIEKGLVSVFVDSHVNQVAEVVGKEMDGFRSEKAEMESRIEGLESDLRSVLEEKSEIERLKSEKESEIGELNRRLEEVRAEIDNERVVSSRVCDEKDEIRAQLDARIREVSELESKVTESDERGDRISEEFTELKAKYDELVEENTESKRRIELVTAEKDSIQTNLVELSSVVDDSKRKIAELIEEKTAVEDEKNRQESENNELQTSVGKLNDSIESMRIKEEEMLKKIADLEKKYVESSKKEIDMKTEIDRLLEEKKESEERIGSLVNEKSSMMKDLEDAKKELEHQKITIEQIIQEKTEIEDAKIQAEDEILKMKDQLIEFQETITSLESSKSDQNEKLNQLEVEVSRYKASLDQVKIERDEAQKGLEEEKAITTDYKQKITTMEKGIQVLNKELEKMTKSNGKHLEEKNELEDRCADLASQVGSLEAKLAETRTEFNATKGRLGLAEAKSKRVLSILKNTISNGDDMGDIDQENGIEEEMKDHIRDLEAIKGAFKDKASIIEDMKMEVELLRNSADEANKGKSFWTMVSSGTTLLAAAVSVAYVTRAH